MRRAQTDITDITDCSTHQEAAYWLLQCSPSDLMRDEAFIRRWLRMAGFRDGLSYLETLLSFLREGRREDGHFINFTTFSVANRRLQRIAEEICPAQTALRVAE